MHRYGIKDYDVAHRLTEKKFNYAEALKKWEEGESN